MAKRNLGGEVAWRRRIEDFRSSGESFSVFAAREGVSAESVRRWVRHFDRERTTTRESTRLVELVAVSEREVTLEPFEVLLGNGHAIRVPQEFDAKGVRVLVEIVAGAQ